MLRKIKNQLGLLGLAALVLACGDSDKFTTESGVEVSYLRQGEGEKPENEQILTMHIAYADENGNDIFNSVEAGQGRPLPMQFNDSAWKTQGVLYEVIRELKKGDSVQFDISAEELFVKTFGAQVPDSIENDSKIAFRLGLANIMSEEEYRAEDMANMEKEMAKQQAEAENQIAADGETIDQYLADNNVDAQTTESGLRYVITKEGAGEAAASGKTVSVHYTGRLLDGTIFDTSNEATAKENDLYNPQRPYEPLEFVLGQGQVIPGWDEGISLLKKGAVATLYIPSSLAYGPRGAGGVIKPNAILKFDVELVDVK